MGPVRMFLVTAEQNLLALEICRCLQPLRRICSETTLHILGNRDTSPVADDSETQEDWVAGQDVSFHLNKWIHYDILSKWFSSLQQGSGWSNERE